MNKIIRGYWDCSYCGTKGIDGLIDSCPNCNAGKKKDTKYYMKSTDDVVSEEELNKAGISVEECDGNHKEWICAYCDNLNNYSNENCEFCGASKKEKECEYGEVVQDEVPVERETDITKPETGRSIISSYSYAKKKSYKEINPRKIIIPIISLILTIILAVGFWPIKETWTVNGFSWNRCVTVEELRTVHESGWSLPVEGRLLYTNREIRSYRDVLDHYETVSVPKTRTVFSHNETTYTYRDNGNGTFTRQSHTTPVYKTETYMDTETKPVYRSEPVYDTKYYYEIDRWFDLKDYKSSGNDKNPYWNTNYTLKELERDTKRIESYYVKYSNGESNKESFDVWNRRKFGDRITVTKCRFGIIYKTEDSLGDDYSPSEF